MCDRLFQSILSNPWFPRDEFRAVEESFLSVDRAYQVEASRTNAEDGTTALAGLVFEDRLIVAHVGDSRGVVGTPDGRVVTLTRDHKPDRPDERVRIESLGGFVTYQGTWRVEGVLAVSRAFGNFYMKEYIIPNPEIREDTLKPGRHVVVFASDGLWDAVGNEEAVRTANKCADPEAAARQLAAEAYLRGSLDNISVIVAFVDVPKPAEKAAAKRAAADGRADDSARASANGSTAPAPTTPQASSATATPPPASPLVAATGNAEKAAFALSPTPPSPVAPAAPLANPATPTAPASPLANPAPQAPASPAPAPETASEGRASEDPRASEGEPDVDADADADASLTPGAVTKVAAGETAHAAQATVA